MTIKQLVKICHKLAVEKGFWEECYCCNGKGISEYIETRMTPKIFDGVRSCDTFTSRDKKIKEKCSNCEGKGYLVDRNNGEMIALMHSELSEALEDLRRGRDNHVGSELADCVIRIMDFAEARNIDLEKEILKKIEKNKKRKWKHGKKF